MMKTKSILLTTFLLLITLWVGAAKFDKATYYSAANNTCGARLKTKMCGIISPGASMLSYSGVWTAFATTDVRSDGYIWDRYCNTNMSYGTNQDTGSGGTEEGQFYNREHSFPKSWFGGRTSAGPGTDLHHVVAADKFGNSKRGNRMYGVVMSNVSKLSNSRYGKGGYGSRTNYDVFEPADEYKGDFARTYFYMVTMYEDSIVSWYNNYGSKYDSGKILDGNKYPGIQDWYMTMLLAWAESDPVDSREENRNNAVYAKQNNRNPFIDFPGLEQYIWGTLKTTNVSISNYVDPYNGTPPTPTPSITLSPTTASVVVGHTVTLAATIENANGATVNWTSSNSDVATVSNDGTVIGVAAGTTNIMASIVVSGVTYTATCAVTVTSQSTIPSEGDIYVKVTSTSDITDGQYLIVYESGNVAFNGGLIDLKATSSSSPNTIPVSIDDNQIPVNSTTEAAEFTLYISAGNIKSKSGYYIGNTSDSNNLEYSTSTAFTNSLSISLNNVDIVGSGGAYLRYNASISGFRYYKSSTYNQQKAIQLYKKTESAPAVPSITLDQTSVTEEVGNTFTLTATTQNADGATVVWASSNPQVATVNDGLVRCVASGATSISATITVNGVSVAATCNVTVVDNSSSGGDGTLDNPYSVAEVLALFASNSVPTSNVYVKGIISRITSLNTAMYANARYYISDDGSETDEFYVYNGKYLNGADFTSDDQIQKGDEVVICGKLTTYGTTNEFAAGNYIVSLKRPSSVLLGDVNRDGNVTIADVTALVNIILGKATEGDSNNYDFKAANVNEDEDITIADVTALVNLILHKE